MGQFRRRQFLIAAGALFVAPVGALAQSSGQLRRVGLLFGSTKEGVAVEMETFAARLRAVIPGERIPAADLSGRARGAK